MRKEQMKKLMLAADFLKIIITMSEQGEDYSPLQGSYNDLIDEYDLPLPKIRWISVTEFEFIK